MNTDEQFHSNLNRIIVVLYIAVIIFGVYQIISALGPYKTTGLLVIKTSNKSAQLSISEEDHQAALVGTGGAHLRLAPGQYQVAAIAGSQRTTAVVTVTKEHTSTVSLNLNNSSELHSVNDVNFSGADMLTNAGLSNDQVSEIEEYLFEFKPTASTISINSGSFEPGPHNPNADDPFTATFTTTIDSSKAYVVTITYSDLNNVSLQIYSESGALVFNSQSSNAISGD